MNFNSLEYYIFLPTAVILYFITPPKFRNPLLLVLSYYFYMNWNPQYAVLIFFSTCITYFCGILIGKKGNKKLWLILSLLINLLILFFFKYYNFFANITEPVFALPYIDVLLPVGISFYTFQALGYTIDVYRNKIPPERNFIDYALFVSFFPQLVAGPIERSTNLLPQFKTVHKFSYNGLHKGICLLLWGLFKKIVIADRAAVIVNYVYLSSEYMNGMQFIIATLAFSIQIYCDFSAYSDIARGSAAMMGFDLMKNFNAPYFAASVKDFWRRWHISLSSWFKDYLYFPLGGSRKSTFRTYLNVLIIFGASGLWHGASLTFIAWGLLNGLYQIVESMMQKLPKIPGSRLFARIATFIFINVSMIVFRSTSIRQSMIILKRIITSTSLSDIIGIGLGLSVPYICVLVFSTLVLAVVDYAGQYRDIPKALCKTGIVKYIVYFLLISAIIVFGYYGIDFNPQEFIYFQF